MIFNNFYNKLNLPHIGFLFLSFNLAFAQTPTFLEVSESSDIDSISVFSDWAGNGASLADFDNDGDIDFFLATDVYVPNRLYRNDGNGKFEEIAENLGLASLMRTRNSLWFDYNGDHLLDLLVLGDCYSTNDCDTTIFLTLYQQKPDGNFVETTESSGLTFNDLYINNEIDFTAGGLAAADINNDNYLDLLVATSGGKKHLFLNNTNGTFSDITIESNVGVESKYFWQPIFYDFNNDGFIDIYCNVDFASNELWLNNKDNTFYEVAELYNASSNFNEMGVSLGDYDNDGDMDIYATNITSANEHNILLKNNTNNGQFINFSEVSSNYGIGESGWDWGTTFFDANNDGWLDLVTTNGKALNSDQSRLWLNNNGNSFIDSSVESGFNDILQGTTLVAFDLERDGDLDLLQTLKINSLNSKPVNVFENQLNTNESNYLVVKPRMLETNYFSIGAVIKIKTGNMNQMRLITAGTSYYGQEPAEAFFGLADNSIVDELQIKWPDGNITTLFDVDVNQVLVIDNSVIDDIIYGCMDPNSCNYNPLANIDNGSCQYLPSKEISGNASSAFYETDAYTYDMSIGSQVLWTVEGGEIISGQGTRNISIKWNFVKQGKITAKESNNSCSSNTSELIVNLNINNLPKDISIPRIWNEALLEAIRGDFARPTVHARNLFHTSIAFYDIWAVYDDEAKPYLLGNQVHGFTSDLKDFTPIETKEISQKKAISYAAYRLLTHRFKDSPGANESLERFNLIMSQLGYNTNNTSINYESGEAAALGNFVAQTIIDYGFTDNSREATGYDNNFYSPVNPALDLNGSQESTTGIIASNRWQPLIFNTFIDQSGNLIEGSTPEFLSPEWGAVHPFALPDNKKEILNRDGNDYTVYYNTDSPPKLNTTNSSSQNQYKWNFELVALWSSHLDPSDGVLWDISPKSIGNIDINLIPSSYEDYPSFYDELDGGDISIGHSLNPVTGKPYETQLVPRADYARVLAEFWADGPDSETPPGHWFTILNYVTDHELFTRKFNGQNNELSPLEWDIKAYFILSGALHDAAIAAWGIKGWHDYIRPISAIRYLCELGQSTDDTLPNYNPDGIELREGYIEVIKSGDKLSGINNENLGKIKLRAWKGHDFINNPTTDKAGVDWILAENWWPYQRPSFVTPPFAGFISGHSTFSRAAAEVMTLITGNEFFPGGMGEFVAKKDEFLVFEKGPSVDVKLQWATYRDASDQTSLSRIWGGIHPPVDDLPGRIIGKQIGIDAYNFAVPYFTGKEQKSEDDLQIYLYPNPVQNKIYFKNIKTKSELTIFSISGRVIFQGMISDSSNYDISGLSQGIYLIKINNSQQNLNQFIIKQ